MAQPSEAQQAAAYFVRAARRLQAAAAGGGGGEDALLAATDAFAAVSNVTAHPSDSPVLLHFLHSGLPSPVDAMLDALQAAQASGRPTMLAAGLRLLWGPLALHIRSRATIPPRLAEAFCSAVTSAAAWLASAAGDSHAAGGGGCPACAHGMQGAQQVAEALAELFTHQLATRICRTDAWWQLPPQQALGMLEAVASAAAACGPAASCRAGCLHPMHSHAASLLRSLHPVLDLHLERLRASLTDASYAQLVRTACAAEAAALAVAHNRFDGMLASPEAAAQVVREHLSFLVDAYFSCRHIADTLAYELPMPPVSDLEGVLQHAGAGAAMARVNLNLRNPRTGEEYPSRLEPRRLLPDFLQLLGPMARLIPKAMLLAQQLTPAVRRAMIAGYPSCMPLTTTTAGNMMVMFCTTLEETFFRIMYMLGHDKHCGARSQAALAARHPQLVEATVAVARYVRTWLGPHSAALRQEFGQRDSPLMRQLTLQAAARPEVLEGVTAEVALVKLCMGFLHTLEHLGVRPRSPPDAIGRLRHWGVVAYALVPQLCGLAEALGQGPTAKQSEALCHLLRCLRSLAQMGLAGETVRAGGGRLLSVTAAAFLAHPDAERLLPDEIWFMQDVALQHPSLWVALVNGGTVAQLLGWAAAHLQKPLAWDLLIIAALVAKCCAQLDPLSGSATLPLLAAVWQGGNAPQQAARSGGGGRAGGRGRGRGRGAAAAQPTAAEGQRLHDELQQEVGRQMRGMKRSVHVFLGELTTEMKPPEPRRYSKKLPEELRARLLRRSLWESLRTRLLPELLAVCCRAVAASEADLPHKDAAMEALALGGPPGAPSMCANPACGSLRGPAEAPLLRLACPGCGVPHYCSAACLRANAGRHAPACGVLHSMHSVPEEGKPAAVVAEDSAAEAAGQLAGLRLEG